jgi:hypothetical protein
VDLTLLAEPEYTVRSSTRDKLAKGEPKRLRYQLLHVAVAIFAPDLTLEDVTVLIDRFISKATRSRLQPFVNLARTIRQHRNGILHAVRLGINQGRTEALNNKVRLITRRAYAVSGAKPRNRGSGVLVGLAG